MAQQCDLAPEDVETFYAWFAQTPRTVTGFSQGINQSIAGTDKGNAIINSHLATGRVGKPGAGPFSLTGQPNAMGGREVGGLANTLAAHMDYDSPGARSRVADFWGTGAVADGPGLKAVDMFEAVHRGDIRVIWIMGTNPAVSLPDSARVREALGTLSHCDCFRLRRPHRYHGPRGYPPTRRWLGGKGWHRHQFGAPYFAAALLPSPACRSKTGLVDHEFRGRETGVRRSI